jgi:hypothetical protein
MKHMRVEEKEWRVKSYVWCERDTSASKFIDRTVPNDEDMNGLMTRYRDYYGKVFNPIEATFRWVQGFERISDGEDIEWGDDIAVNYGNGDQNKYLRMGRCLEVTWQSVVYYWIFPLWYTVLRSKRRVANMGPSLSMVKRWSSEGNDVLPVTPRIFISRVLIVHQCVRKCRRKKCNNPLSCGHIAMCMLAQYCTVHGSYTCSPGTCEQHLVWHDRHSEKLTTYYVFDESWGFKSSM